MTFLINKGVHDGRDAMSRARDSTGKVPWVPGPGEPAGVTAEVEHMASCKASLKAAFILPEETQSFCLQPLPGPLLCPSFLFTHSGPRFIFGQERLSSPLWLAVRAMGWPHQEKGGQKESSLAVREGSSWGWF